MFPALFCPLPTPPPNNQPHFVSQNCILFAHVATQMGAQMLSCNAIRCDAETLAPMAQQADHVGRSSDKQSDQGVAEAAAAPQLPPTEAPCASEEPEAAAAAKAADVQAADADDEKEAAEERAKTADAADGALVETVAGATEANQKAGSEALARQQPAPAGLQLREGPPKPPPRLQRLKSREQQLPRPPDVGPERELGSEIERREQRPEQQSHQRASSGQSASNPITSMLSKFIGKLPATTCLVCPNSSSSSSVSTLCFLSPLNSARDLNAPAH